MATERRVFATTNVRVFVALDGVTVLDARMETARNNLSSYAGTLVTAGSDAEATSLFETAVSRASGGLEPAQEPGDFFERYADPRKEVPAAEIDREHTFTRGSERARVIVFENSLVSVWRWSNTGVMRHTFECGWGRGAKSKAVELETALRAEGFAPEAR